MYIELLLFSYFIDMVFGEFKIKHIVCYMGDFITFFEKRFYRDSIFSGLMLWVSLITITSISADILIYLLSFLPFSNLFMAIFGSMLIASNMLYKSVKEALDEIEIEKKRLKLSYLVSRDTKDLNNSDINRALIETYGENLSDGVIAPLFYMLFFGIKGALIYKAINTLDSMVGYKNEKYINFGKVSAKCDDIANYIPSRITALLILLLGGKFKYLKHLVMAKYHESPNAGYPITAIALFVGVKLGGNCSYFGKIKSKPYFGIGRVEIYDFDTKSALSIKKKFDFFILFSLVFIYFI